MVGGGQPLDRLRWLDGRRSRQYQQANDIIFTNDLVPEEVAARVVAGLVGRGLLAGPSGSNSVAPRTVEVTARSSYNVMVAWGGLATLGRQLAELGLPRRLHVVADAAVARMYEPAVMSALVSANFDPLVYRVPPGEASKSREELFAIYDWLVERRAERSEAVVSLGGGVASDLAGFAAATYLRGVPFVQVPTSLLAQVDASIGGKVGINHPRGKNLLGAFYQPRLVLADPATLLTLPARQRTEGWAEVIKHGVVLDAGYFEALEREAEALLSLEPGPLTRIIARSVSLKAEVVEADERERDGGRRHLLNYGHTIGHAIESVAGYGRWLHGEAVAAGMMAEAILGRRLGLTSPQLITRQEALLGRYGLPTRAEGLSASALLFASLWDKKVREGRTRWVLPTELGQATLVADVDEAEVRAALREVGADE
jgi:3-dehydroquinate synthase